MKRLITLFTAVYILFTGIFFTAIQKNDKGSLMVTAGATDVSAESAIVIDAKTGDTLYEKNADKKMYPASTTKIMTALVTIEILEELDSPKEQKIKVPVETTGTEGSSIYLEPGEEISIEDLLYGLMLRSGNDAAETLAFIMTGNREAFVERMNEKADEIGCRNTHFVNPSGLYDKEHYTTARDMAKISKNSMENGTFRKIVSSKIYKAERVNEKNSVFYNKNKTVHRYKGGNGIKIGYTSESGRTLAASAERDGKTLICVVMNAPDWFNDAYRLMDICFGDTCK